MNRETLKDIHAKNTIDFSTLPNYIDFIEKVETIFRSKKESDKELINMAGGYKNIFRLADEYYNQECDTVNEVTGRFLALASLKDAMSLKIKDDDSGYRFKVLERFNVNYGFRYPSEFTFARTLVIVNYDLSSSVLGKTHE